MIRQLNMTLAMSTVESDFADFLLTFLPFASFTPMIEIGIELLCNFNWSTWLFVIDNSSHDSINIQMHGTWTNFTKVHYYEVFNYQSLVLEYLFHSCSWASNQPDGKEYLYLISDLRSISLTKNWIGSWGLFELTAFSAGKRWGTTMESRYCLLLIVLISGMALVFLLSGSSPAMIVLEKIKCNKL